MFARPASSKNPKQTNQTSKTIATKKLIVQEYKDRLKNNVKSLNDNFECIFSSLKVRGITINYNLSEFDYSKIQINDDASLKANSTGRLAEYYALKNEAMARSALMVKATDELQMLTK
jgi:hypothetical protein